MMQKYTREKGAQQAKNNSSNETKKNHQRQQPMTSWQLLTRANCCKPAEHDPYAAPPGYNPLSAPIKVVKKITEPPDFWSRILRQTAFIRNHEAIKFILTIFLNSSSDSCKASCMGPASNTVQLTRFTVE